VTYKVILKGHILVPAADLDQVKAELENHKNLTLKESGCLIFQVTPDEQDPFKYNVYEEFISQEAFDIHQARVKASRWGEVTKNVERHYFIKNE
jgi:autoinducer 2-degrading protein